MKELKKNTGGKLKIAMLGHKRIPSREGGVEVVAEALAVRMVQRGHDVTCYNRSGCHGSGKGFDGEGLQMYRGIRLKWVPTVDRKGLAAVTSSITASFAAAFGDYDVVHYHGEGPCAMLWLPKLFGKRCIATVHGLDWDREKWRKSLGRWYIKLGERIAVRYADEIIVLSRNLQDYFHRVYHRQTHWIPNGAERPERCPGEEIDRKYGLKQGQYLLYLGRLVPEKGLRYLIRAFQKVETDKKLVIAGGVSDSDDFFAEIQAMAAADGRIIFTGFVEGRLLAELYSSCYLYVLPSDLEGMPLTLLEAMSHGNCCLISDIPECTETAGEWAMTFRQGDVDDLREKLQQLCDWPELAGRFRAGAAEHILKKYRWDDIVTQTLALYRGNVCGS